MAKNGVNKENLRNIQKSKRSYYITLPIAYLRKLGWDKAGKMLVVRGNGQQLIIESFKNYA